MTDLENLAGMLTRAAVDFRMWPVKEMSRPGTKEAMKLNPRGMTVVFGSPDEGPYAELTFDNEGKLLPGGACAGYSETLGSRMKCVTAWSGTNIEVVE